MKSGSYYILDIENENNIALDDEDKLDIFKTVFADVDGHKSDGYDYRLAKSEKPSNENQVIKPQKKKMKLLYRFLPCRWLEQVLKKPLKQQTGNLRIYCK